MKAIQVVLNVLIQSLLWRLLLQVPHFPQHEKASHAAENASKDELDALKTVKFKLKKTCISLCLLAKQGGKRAVNYRKVAISDENNEAANADLQRSRREAAPVEGGLYKGQSEGENDGLKEHKEKAITKRKNYSCAPAHLQTGLASSRTPSSSPDC